MRAAPIPSTTQRARCPQRTDARGRGWWTGLSIGDAAIACLSLIRLLMTRSTLSVCSRSVEPELDKCHDRDDEEEHDRHRRGFASVEKDEGGLVDIERQDQGGVHRTALGHHELRNENLKSRDQTDDRREQDCRLQERERDVAENPGGGGRYTSSR